MNILKWIMKQYWRIGTIRAWLSLAMSMFVLGRLYYIYIPFLQPYGLLGALFLGGLFILIFMGLGWLYDTRMKMWAPQIQATVERDPYYYVPRPQTHMRHYPMIWSFIDIADRIMEKLSIDTGFLDDFRLYMLDYFTSEPLKEDIREAPKKAKSFSEEHPFLDMRDREERAIDLVDKAKLGFQVQMKRVNWIQSLTGLFQDVLVFTAFYIAFLIPNLTPGETIPPTYMIVGIFAVGVPLFLVLAGLGWIYDRKLKVWSPERIVSVERKPYSYVPNPYYFSKQLPMIYCIMNFLISLESELNISLPNLHTIIKYLKEYNSLSASRDEDMKKAKLLGESFKNIFTVQQKVVE